MMPRELVTSSYQTACWGPSGIIRIGYISMITRKNPKQCLKNARQEEDIYIGWVTGKKGFWHVHTQYLLLFCFNDDLFLTGVTKKKFQRTHMIFCILEIQNL